MPEFWEKLLFDDTKRRDVEVNTHEMQFALERILGMEADDIRKQFEKFDNVAGVRHTSKLYQKANFLFTKRYKNHPDRYKLRSNMEYNEEFNE